LERNPDLAQPQVTSRTGDGALAEFASVVDAWRCAAEIQRAMAERNAGIPGERRIDFRIGTFVACIWWRLFRSPTRTIDVPRFAIRHRRVARRRGTEGSNPAPSSAESWANSVQVQRQRCAKKLYGPGSARLG
jgi:hypothetical protein